MSEILKINDLTVNYQTKEGEFTALEKVSLKLEEGTCLGILGESGCGKTTLAMSVVKLLPYNAKIIRGQINYQGNNLLQMSEIKLHNLRGREIAYIFQDPVSALNPVMSIGAQIIETLVNLRHFSYKEAFGESIRLLNLVKVPDPLEHLRFYPHQLSGGLNQRVMIALALSTNAKVLIADEPTSNLDVTIEAAIIELLKDLQTKLGLSIIFISHDLSLIRFLSDNTAIMYKGKIIEFDRTHLIFNNPKQLYTKELLQATDLLSRI
ncbi:MAG: ABC transporter ATP-binding protein [Candidatus Omnitrophota bacterium]